MPYIKRRDDKNDLDNNLRDPANEGELNYKITKQCIKYLHMKGESYKTINEIMGVLECAKLEFYRRVGVPYEDEKIKENGDVY